MPPSPPSPIHRKGSSELLNSWRPDRASILPTGDALAHTMLRAPSQPVLQLSPSSCRFATSPKKAPRRLPPATPGYQPHLPPPQTALTETSTSPLQKPESSTLAHLRPSPVFVGPSRGSCFEAADSPTCAAPGYYDCAITKAPWSLAAGVPLPRKCSPSFLALGRNMDVSADAEGSSLPRRLRHSASMPARTPLPRRVSPPASRPESKAGKKDDTSGTMSTGRLLRQRQKELSPSTFAAEVEGTLEHRIARVVVVPATNLALRRLRESSPERFESTDSYVERQRGVQPSTLSLKVASYQGPVFKANLPY